MSARPSDKFDRGAVTQLSALVEGRISAGRIQYWLAVGAMGAAHQNAGDASGTCFCDCLGNTGGAASASVKRLRL